MTWWAWMILGAFLFGAELLAIDAQFYLVFLGISAALVGVLDLLGIAMPEWVQWLVFAASRIEGGERVCIARSEGLTLYVSNNK